MAIAQIQGLQAFVMNHVVDVIDWSKHVRPDPSSYPLDANGAPKMTGDEAFILITTPFNRYKMSIASSYLEPPAGAPLACKSLGTVTFHDLSEGKRIVGPKADLTWMDISKHIHVREYTDALAAARRECAEAGPPIRNESGEVVDNPAQRAHAKLVQVAEKAVKWGVGGKVPEPNWKPGEVVALDDPRLASLQAGLMGAANAAASQQMVTQQMVSPAPSGEAPWLGAPVVFITNPGESISGMSEIPGWCVKVASHDRISVFMTPDHSEPSYRDGLPRRGSPAGNGKVHQYNCWDFNPAALRELSRIRHLEEAIERMADEGNRDRQEIANLMGRIEALEGTHTKHGDLKNDPKAAEKSKGKRKAA